MNIDSVTPVIVPEFDIHPDIMDQIVAIYHVRWLSIMSYCSFGKRSSTYNLRLGDGGFDLTIIQKAKTFL